MRPQWCTGTIGAVSDLVKQKQAEWDGKAIRRLFELEMAANHLRAQLEHGDTCLANVDHQASDLLSHVMNLMTLIDRAQGLKLAGIE